MIIIGEIEIRQGKNLYFLSDEVIVELTSRRRFGMLFTPDYPYHPTPETPNKLKRANKITESWRGLMDYDDVLGLALRRQLLPFVTN